MKVVVIGGGIAGLAVSNFLLEKGFEVSLHEREHGNQARGHAFLMHPAGIEILQRLGQSRQGVPIPGQLINQVCISRPDLSQLDETPLDNWLCLSRSEAVQYLHYLLPPGIVKFGHSFSSLEYRGETAVAAHFQNGEVEEGDLFIAADGAKSLVRQALFGETAFSKVEVKEIVGVVNLPALIQNSPYTFRKFIARDKGLTLGYIPCSGEKLVWFMQFDVRFLQNEDESPAALESLCRKLLIDFPEEVAMIMDTANFSNVYVWNSTDFDLLPTFNKENVFLIGDAAHLALPFTSAGTTNALQDALTLSELLNHGFDIREAGKQFYSLRAPLVAGHIAFGRSLKSDFLQPSAEGSKFNIPLIRNITSQG